MLFIIEDSDIASHACNNIPYDNINGVIKSLEEASEILFKWFNNNLMKTNAVKGLDVWVFGNEVSGCGFESICSCWQMSFIS